MNIVGFFRSNYFAVKDRNAFETWCQRHRLDLIIHQSYHELVGFTGGQHEAGIPWRGEEESEAKDGDYDFLGELGSFLQDNYVAIVIEIVQEGNRYLDGAAYAVNSRGERRSIGLATDILPLAQQLGSHITECEYRGASYGNTHMQPANISVGKKIEKRVEPVQRGSDTIGMSPYGQATQLLEREWNSKTWDCETLSVTVITPEEASARYPASFEDKGYIRYIYDVRYRVRQKNQDPASSNDGWQERSHLLVQFHPGLHLWR